MTSGSPFEVFNSTEKGSKDEISTYLDLDSARLTAPLFDLENLWDVYVLRGPCAVIQDFESPIKVDLHRHH